MIGYVKKEFSSDKANCNCCNALSFLGGFAADLRLYMCLSNSYTMGCPPVRGDNPRALASGLSYVQVDKHGITILYHLHQCRPCTSGEIFRAKLGKGGINRVFMMGLSVYWTSYHFISLYKRIYFVYSLPMLLHSRVCVGPVRNPKRQDSQNEVYMSMIIQYNYTKLI